LKIIPKIPVFRRGKPSPVAIYEGLYGTPHLSRKNAGIVKTRISQPGFRGTQGCHLRYYLGVRRADTFFNISSKIVFSIRHHTLKQIALDWVPQTIFPLCRVSQA